MYKRRMGMSEYFEEMTNRKAWIEEVDNLLEKKGFSKEFVMAFHTNWTVRAHRIREQISNDKKLSMLLQHIFPVYAGEGKILYRGENKKRWGKGNIGFCWTTDKEIAVMFARGLNSINTGGLLLECDCKPEWIIIGPSDHSNYLGESEYTVNPELVTGIKVLLEYDPLEQKNT